MSSGGGEEEFEDLLPSSDYEELAALIEDDFNEAQNTSAQSAEQYQEINRSPDCTYASISASSSFSSMQNSRTQVNLFGRAVGVAAGVIARQTNAFVTRAPRPFEPLYLESRPQRSHHTLVHDNLKTWVYPTNVAVRDYQRNIAERAILTNTLVALPTGLGKTLIAAVVMLNYYRWTKDSKIVFMAPTRPLVTQQAEACYKIAGIPRDDTALFVGSAASPAVREQIWNEKRVFFTTPQILDNDLKRGTVDPKKVVCLVIDEAHRAAGAYSYVNVVQFIKRFSEEVRILALSATPGSSVEAVQNVIKNLSISHAEIRTELSDDVKGFVRGSKVEHYSAELTDEGYAVLSNFGQVLQPMLTELNNANVYFVRDPEKISLYGLVLARGDFQRQYGMRGMNSGYKWKIESTFNLITPLAHALGLLKNHGIKPFYEYISNWEKAQRFSDTGKAKKPGKGATSVLNNPHYKRMMQLAQKAIDQGAVSHEKINLLVAKLVEFFTDEEVVADQSKVIVFCEYRSSASELLRVLSEVESVKPHLFIGQSSAKDQTNIEAGQGMSQKEQQKVLDDFKVGIYNTLIATSIGEEGLDIGQVDMIICYDASSSPVRVLQRMGRTGRFRKGKIIAILTENERMRFDQALQKYEEIQKSISDISNFEFVPCARILPDDVTPDIDLRTIDIPPENEEEPTIATASSVKKRTRKAPAKKFNMPDDVETSFTSAASLLDTSKKRSRAKANQENVAFGSDDSRTPSKIRRGLPSDKSSPAQQHLAKSKDEMINDYGLLTAEQERKLNRKYPEAIKDDTDTEAKEYDPVQAVAATPNGQAVDGRIGKSTRTKQVETFVAATRSDHTDFMEDADGTLLEDPEPDVVEGEFVEDIIKEMNMKRNKETNKKRNKEMVELDIFIPEFTMTQYTDRTDLSSEADITDISQLRFDIQRKGKE